MHGTFRATEVKRSKGKEIKLRPVRPNVGLHLAYQKKLDRLIQEMNASIVFHLKAAYRANPPILAMDDILPANALKRAIALLKKRWLRRFDLAAPKLAEYFALAVHKRTDKALAKILRDGGFSVRFVQTQVMKDVVQATIAENVSLIKSIPQKFLGDVEVHVMQSISRGRDLGTLAKYLEKTYGITKRRSAFIAQSQNNLATAAMNRVRQVELGITKARWKHSNGGRVPRYSHVKASKDGVIYDTSKGWFDPVVKEWIFPGQLPGCRCVSISIVPGFS